MGVEEGPDGVGVDVGVGGAGMDVVGGGLRQSGWGLSGSHTQNPLSSRFFPGGHRSVTGEAMMGVRGHASAALPTWAHIPSLLYAHCTVWWVKGSVASEGHSQPGTALKGPHTQLPVVLSHWKPGSHNTKSHEGVVFSSEVPFVAGSISPVEEFQSAVAIGSMSVGVGSHAAELSHIVSTGTTDWSVSEGPQSKVPSHRVAVSMATSSSGVGRHAGESHSLVVSAMPPVPEDASWHAGATLKGEHVQAPVCSLH